MDRQTDDGEMNPSFTLLCRRHKNFMLFYTQTQVGGRTGSWYSTGLMKTA